MARVTCHMSVSLDGYVAGTDQSLEHPLGIGGPLLHHWHLGEVTDPVDFAYRDAILAGKGAYVMGRHMFGPVRGPWTALEWRGWWGDEPPYHAPVFVLTHHAHAPIELTGTTFHFVTDGFDAALTLARDAAGDLDVDIAGGASTVHQALRADAVDELTIDLVPVLLGAGERLFDDVPPSRFEIAEAAHSPHATHIRYRRVRS